MRSLDKLRLAWKRQGIELLSPETEHRVIEVFERFGVRPSPQVIEMYSAVGGFETMDDEGWRLWTLKDIEAEFPDEDAARGIQFSDFLICCWCFRLRPTPSGEMQVVLDAFNGKPPFVVAENLSTTVTCIHCGGQVRTDG